MPKDTCPNDMLSLVYPDKLSFGTCAFYYEKLSVGTIGGFFFCMTIRLISYSFNSLSDFLLPSLEF